MYARIYEQIRRVAQVALALVYKIYVLQAFVIAYTSDFIPRSVYTFVYSPTEDLVNYIDSSLSEFNTSDYRDDMKSDVEDEHPETCQYRGYRNGPDHPDDKYGLSPQYWHVFAARLAFVVVFEHIVSRQTCSVTNEAINWSFRWRENPFFFFLYRFSHLLVL